MMEVGFYHPNKGYWQGVADETASLPDGAVVVPLIPGPDSEWSWNGAEWVELAPDPASLRAAITAERDRRLSADFTFAGKQYQRDPTSLARITGAATLAGFAVAGGAQVGDLRWANPARDFGWIASDNSVTPMDAQTAFAFGQTAAAVETTIVFAAKALRDMDPIPDNFTDDVWWS